MNQADSQSLVSKIKGGIEKVIIGKPDKITVVLAAFICGRHVLLEDVPGTGKTMLAKTLAKTVGLKFSRIQFTPDLLPSDITGINVYNPKTNEFDLKKGAVFTNILLADEINRATPRTQSALLECMEEKQVTIDAESYTLEPPFFVIATQNPVETHGTFPLPEAQLDRFAVKLSLGYPGFEEGVKILKLFGGSEAEVSAACSAGELSALREYAASVYVHDEILAYIVTLAEKTRSHEYVSLGVSIRGALALRDVCRAYAVMQGRGFVIPDDVQYMVPYVFAHRMIYRGGLDKSQSVLDEIVRGVVPPVENWSKK